MSSSSSSNILTTLPLLPLSQILKKLNIQDLLNLSSENESIGKFIQNIPIRSGGFDVCLDERGCLVQMLKQDFIFQRYDKSSAVVMETFIDFFNVCKTAFPDQINKLDVCPLTFSNLIHSLPNEYSTLTDEDVNSLLHTFMQGTGNNKLKVMTIQKENGWSMETVLKGFNVEKKVENQTFKLDKEIVDCSIDYSDRWYEDGVTLRDAFNITRSDGTVFTVDSVMSTLRIHVWPLQSKKTVSRKRRNEDSIEGSPKKQCL
ncbi:hypothetical protein CAEBREN_09164 [Caenorhabditis brenneri]|uniref:F-box domain-containing protein n=1 Tax=Caenorhabditis brenneri TaxID=135651 RepID=G0MND6_CAEBE|nr:hypothetical protein CAEBREN_09164 [Caenorhabditis brenneri]